MLSIYRMALLKLYQSIAFIKDFHSSAHRVLQSALLIRTAACHHYALREDAVRKKQDGTQDCQPEKFHRYASFPQYFSHIFPI